MHMYVLILYYLLSLLVPGTRTAPAGAGQVSLRGLGWHWPVGAGWSRLEPAGAGSPNPHVTVAHPEGAGAHSGATA